jgi:hypothetical protein
MHSGIVMLHVVTMFCIGIASVLVAGDLLGLWPASSWWLLFAVVLFGLAVALIVWLVQESQSHR